MPRQKWLAGGRCYALSRKQLGRYLLLKNDWVCRGKQPETAVKLRVASRQQDAGTELFPPDRAASAHRDVSVIVVKYQPECFGLRMVAFHILRHIVDDLLTPAGGVAGEAV